MSRTTLCLVTAAALVLLSAGTMVGRYRVLGDALKVPGGPGTWKVTLVVGGKCSSGDGKVLTAVPPDFGHQHVLHDLCRSSEFLAKPRDGGRQVVWNRRVGLPGGAFRLRHELFCTVDEPSPTAAMVRQQRLLYAAPVGEACLKGEPLIESDDPGISALARRLTVGVERHRDECESLYRFVEQEVVSEPTVQPRGISARDTLRSGVGDSGGKARLLVALCRNRGIPARIVTGLTLRRGPEQAPHTWAEAWVNDHWLAMCPFYRHFGRVPPTYLVFQFGDGPLVRGRHVRELHSAFLVERSSADEGLAGEPSGLKGLLTRLSLFALPPAERHLVEFLLLLPIATSIVCLYRNVIGLTSFGTFAPALLGLAFRDLASLPGILVFGGLVLVGWVMRRWLDRYHLLQVPRVALLLSLVVVVLIGTIVAANVRALPVTRYFSLFPLVILTGIVERFWTLEAEDGTASSFRTLLGTALIAATVSCVLSLTVVVRHMLRFPETLGIIMAVQLLLGRYTGYRLTELFRFRDFVAEPAVEGS